MNTENFKISEEHEKMIKEMKFLLSLNISLTKPDLLKLLNKIPPFVDYPLDSVPPIDFCEINDENGKIVTQDLKQELQTFCFIIMRGSMVISRQNYRFSEQKYLDTENIRQKSVYNFDEGKSTMTAVSGTVYLRIHHVWIKKAKKRAQHNQKDYIKYKLIQLKFFSQLSFEEFNKCCQSAFIKKLGPNEVLLQENKIPYHMYIVAEGQLGLETKIKFSNEKNLWNQVKAELKKNTQLGDQLFYYLTRQPKQNDPIFEIDFVLKQIYEGQIFAAKQTLLEQPLPYTVRSTLASKIICIKYPDLFALKEERLTQIKNWPILCEINKKQLRRQYYSQKTWQDFKKFLKQENQLSKIERIKFDNYLRKDANLNSKRYNYFPQKVGQGKIIQSPAASVLKIKILSKPSGQNKKLS